MTRRPRYHLADLLLIIALCGLVLGLVQWFRSIGQAHHSFAPFLLFEVGFIAWFIIWVTVRAKRRATECKECGRRYIPPKKIAGPAICPQCRQRSLRPEQLRKESAKHIRTFILSLAILAVFIGFLLSGPVGNHFRRYYWIVLPLVSLVVVLGLIALLFLIFVVVALIRLWLSRSERYVLTRARKSAGEAGEEARLGPITIWYSGPTDPVPMLQEQMETSRLRFEDLFGEVPETGPPLRILCFSQRSAFVAFHRQNLSNLWNLDGLYAPGPARTITLSTEVVPYRLADPERTARSLFVYYFLEATKGYLPRPWLQQGITNVLASGGDGDERARLNRKMIASLSRGTALDAELFRIKPGALVKLVRRWYDHHSFEKFAQFNAQSWSLVEYLGGEEAPEERRGRFRAFYHDLQAKVPDEEVFERHFGHGFVPLLDGWREWVLGRGIGSHEAPPPHFRDALTDRIIPIIKDPQAKFMDRIQAIRDMGRVGYALGVDSLIDLLREGEVVPREEIVWALEAISGQAWGDDPDRWTEWWDGLPIPIRQGRDLSADQTVPPLLPAPASDGT
jgi:hypothetical protein